jgi:hypothetical protein
MSGRRTLCCRSVSLLQITAAHQDQCAVSNRHDDDRSRVRCFVPKDFFEPSLVRFSTYHFSPLFPVALPLFFTCEWSISSASWKGGMRPWCGLGGRLTRPSVFCRDRVTDPRNNAAQPRADATKTFLASLTLALFSCFSIHLFLLLLLPLLPFFFLVLFVIFFVV